MTKPKNPLRSCRAALLSCTKSLDSLKGLKVCHTKYRKTTGWSMKALENIKLRKPKNSARRHYWWRSVKSGMKRRYIQSDWSFTAVASFIRVCQKCSTEKTTHRTQQYYCTQVPRAPARSHRLTSLVHYSHPLAGHAAVIYRIWSTLHPLQQIWQYLNT